MKYKKYQKALFDVSEDEEGIGFSKGKPIDTYVKIPKNYYRKGTFCLTTLNFFTLIKNARYNSLTIRLLAALVERIDFNNRIKTFRQADLAKELETNQSHISTSLKVLEKDGLIEKRDYDYYFTGKFIQYASDEKRRTPDIKKD